MPTLRFEGYSDDTFGEYAHTTDDYDNCASREPIRYLVTGPRVSPSEPAPSIIVTGQYAVGKSTGWTIGVSHYDQSHNDLPLPDWPMRIVASKETSYSPALIIDAPEGVTLRCLEREQDNEEDAGA